MLIPILLYGNHRLLTNFGVLDPSSPNPFEKFLFPSYRLPNGMYIKGRADLLFFANYIVFWTL
jgi:hypothetical protein